MGGGAGRVGLFGKVPSRGDFVRRGLPNGFVDRWDPWLQRGIADSHDALGAGWADAWLCAPVWRFALGAGVCGPQAWAGVLMPSVDGAGRYFPLTLAGQAAGSEPPVSAVLDPWMDELERLALSALGDDVDFEQLAARIEASPPVPDRTAGGGPWRGASTPFDPVGLAAALLAAGGGRAGRVLLATRGGDLVAPATTFALDLPVAGAFTALISDGSLRPLHASSVDVRPAAAIPADISHYLPPGPPAAADEADGDLFGSVDSLPALSTFEQADDAASAPAAAAAFDLSVGDLPPLAGGGAFDAALGDDAVAGGKSGDLFGAGSVGADDDLFGDSGTTATAPASRPVERLP